MRIIIIGAGVIGTSTAYFLHKKGFDVSVLEAELEAGTQTSFANGAQLSYGYTNPLATPSLLPKLPKLLCGLDAGFRLTPKWDIDLFFWLASFLRNCTKERQKENMLNLLRLGLYSRKVLHQLLQFCPLDFHHQTTGKLVLYKTQRELKEAILIEAIKQKHFDELKYEVKNRAECYELLPHLGPTKKIAGGIFSPQEEVGDCHLFTKALAAHCAKQGVKFLYDTKVKGFVLEKPCSSAEQSVAQDGSKKIQAVKTNRGEIEGDVFVMAAGIGAVALCKMLGLRFGIYPLKGYSVSLPLLDFGHKISITDSEHKIVYSALGDRLRIAGIADLCGYDKRIKRTRIKKMIEIARKTFPNAAHYNLFDNAPYNALDNPSHNALDDVSDNVSDNVSGNVSDNLSHNLSCKEWTGLRPATPHAAPILGRSRIENLYLNIGHGMLGWTLAAGSGALISDLIDNKSPAIGMKGLYGNDSKMMMQAGNDYNIT